MTRHLSRVVTGALSLLPLLLLRFALRLALRDRSVALCLHRVGERRGPVDPVPRMTIPQRVLDDLLETLVAAGPWREPQRLTVTFDDGYASAAAYVRERASRFPQVEWIYFVCPGKTEKGAGFRWDLYERLRRQGDPALSLPAFLTQDLDVKAENDRADLKAVALEGPARLAGIEECRSLARMPNVELGNHTNCHFKPVWLPEEAFQAELASSLTDFERLFGPCRHLAFPFGTPGLEFGPTHVQRARAAGDYLLWSTESRAFDPGERTTGAVLPRFAIDGRLSVRSTLAFILFRTLRASLGRSAPAWVGSPNVA